jgi:putative aminopeptidase FrvX
MPLDIKLMAEICEVAGAPGYEKRIRDIVIREITPLVDEVSVDNLGT